MSKPSPPKLSDPASQPRKPMMGHRERERPIFRKSGGEGFGQWEVEVTPLRGATNIGRGIGSGRFKPRALFEIRTAYYGTGLPEFGSQPNTRLAQHTHTEDEELAKAIARTIEPMLREGQRGIDLLQIERDVKRRRQ